MAKAVDKAYQTVRERIVRGVYPAASRITEQEVAAVAGVSRTPVREALRKLHAEGLLEFVPHQGAIVAEWTAEDRDDVFELRALLEAYGAARAARRMTAEGIAELRQLAEDQYHETLSKTEGYLERVGDLNSQFHRRIHEFAGSPRLVERVVVADRSAADDEDVRELPGRGPDPQRLASPGNRACAGSARRRLECGAHALAYPGRARSVATAVSCTRIVELVRSRRGGLRPTLVVESAPRFRRALDIIQTEDRIMTIKVGDKMPSGTLTLATQGRAAEGQRRRLLQGPQGRAVLGAGCVHADLRCQAPAGLRREGGRHQEARAWRRSPACP